MGGAGGVWSGGVAADDAPPSTTHAHHYIDTSACPRPVHRCCGRDNYNPKADDSIEPAWMLGDDGRPRRRKDSRLEEMTEHAYRHADTDTQTRNPATLSPRSSTLRRPWGACGFHRSVWPATGWPYIFYADMHNCGAASTQRWSLRKRIPACCAHSIQQPWRGAEYIPYMDTWSRLIHRVD